MLTRALLTDFYELTMAAAYHGAGKLQDTAVFDLYYRRNPFKGGYAIAAGLEDAMRAILELRFSTDDIGFLRSLRGSRGMPVFKDEFLSYLESFRFTGDVRAIPEGTVVFPNEPLVQVSGNLIECQVIETILLCYVNFQTLIATKAARMWEACDHGSIVEFGLRRAQGPDGAMSACRAAYIGGAEGTSNVLASARLGIPVKGTHAHSWVQTFASELDSFRAFAASFPDDCVLLVDTYNTSESGVPNAVLVAKEMEQAGHRLAAIRIDSGDLAFLSRRARRMLDEAGLGYVKIIVSNELDEYVIAEILSQGGKVDSWGVGTNLVVGSGEDGGALGGVYKLVEHNGEPRIKVSSNPEKMTNPGAKKVVRFFNGAGLMEADALAHPSEDLDARRGVMIIDPSNPLRRKQVLGRNRVELLERVVSGGDLVYSFPPLQQVRARREEELAHLHTSYRRLHNPHEYKVGVTSQMWRLKEQLLTAQTV